MSKLRKRIAVLIIACMLAPTIVSLIPGIGALTAKEVSAAASSAKLTYSKLEVGVNSSPQFIMIDNYNGAATYTYESQDEKIATVTEYGMVQGVKVGKTKVDVTEKYNGNTTQVGTVSVNVVEAYLDDEMKVGVNSMSWVNINCSNNDATYTYKSSDKKIVEVDKYGTVTGVKLGSTKISVTQKLKGKTKKIGSIKVKVVKSELGLKEVEVPVSDYSYGMVDILYANQKATYKYTSENKKIATVDKYGYITGVKLGSTKIKVTETYNKKTVDLGSITVKVVGASLYEDGVSYEVGLGSSYYLTDIIAVKFMDYSAYYYAKSEDDKVISLSEVDDYGTTFCKMNAVGLGTTKLTIYEEKNKKSKELGTVTVSVKEYPVEALSFYEGALENVKGVPTLKMEYTSESSWYNVRDFLYVQPYNTTTPINCTSSNESVVTVNNTGYITTVAPGTATLTITCGDFSVTMNVVIQAVPATSISFDSFYYDYDYDNDRCMGTFYLGLDYSGSSLKDGLIIDPYNTTDKITYSSSDESIIKIDANGYVTPVKKGTAVITVKCGKVSTSLTANVEE